MVQKYRIHRAVPIGACGLIVLLQAQPGMAKEKRACTAGMGAFKAAQQSGRDGRLRQARELLQTCAQESQSSCPGLAQKCSARYKELSADLPSVVPLVTDDTGSPRVDVEVKIDGELLTSELDGRALPVDPGLHEFSFAVSGRVFVTQKVLVAEGQHYRPLSAVFRAPDFRPVALSMQAESEPKAQTERLAMEAAPHVPTPEPSKSEEPPRSRPSVWPFVIGSAGIAAVGAGALMTVWGRNDNDLLARCSPHCSASSVDHIRTMYIAADVSLGAGAAALGLATWLFLKPHGSEDRPPAQSAYRLGVQPIQSGAYASVSGAF